MLLTHPYAWMAHTRMCFSHITNVRHHPRNVTLLNTKVCVCVLYWSKSQVRRAVSARASKGYIKPPNEQSGHKQDKYRNHEHTHF